MADNLNMKNGKASMFSVKEVPWHGLGTVLEKCPTSKEALKAAQLDFKVEKSKSPVLIRIAGGKFATIEGKFGTYRTDTNTAFGVVGKNYTVVQNEQAFDFFDAIVGKGEAIYETAGCLNKGEIVFITAKLPDFISVQGDDISKYLFLTMAHDGTGSIQAMFTNVRVVCNNTLQAALKDGTSRIRIRHSSNASEKLKTAHEIMGISNRLSKELSEIYNKMAKTSITDKKLKEYIEQVFLPEQKMLEKAGGKSDVLSTRFKNQFNEILEYIEVGPGQQIKSTKGTVFGAYNAVTGYFQNVRDYKNPEVKMKINILDSNRNTANKAFQLAVGMIK